MVLLGWFNPILNNVRNFFTWVHILHIDAFYRCTPVKESGYLTSFIYLLRLSSYTAAYCQHQWNVFIPKNKTQKTGKKKAKGEYVKKQREMTLMLNFLEAVQPDLHAFISYLLRRILLCQCVLVSVRDDSVMWSALELLSTPCRASRSQRDLACTPEMHDGWDRDVWCKLSHPLHWRLPHNAPPVEKKQA